MNIKNEFLKTKDEVLRTKDEISVILKKSPAILKHKALSAGEYIFVFFKWILLSFITGGLGGCIGTAFNITVNYGTNLRTTHPWLIFLLPVGGVIIVASYKLSKVEMKIGTDQVIDSIRTNKRVPVLLIPLIFFSTAITHLFGGSAGREGAALQIGGGLGNHLGRLFRLDDRDQRTITLCGMSAVFASLFGTPFTATVFSLEVISIGILHYSALLPCLCASLIATAISSFFKQDGLSFSLSNIPDFTLINILKIVGISAICAIVSIVFCLCLKYTQKFFKRFFKNEFVRIIIGGILVIGLTCLIGNQNYNGTGMAIIDKAIYDAQANWYDFLLKILFTAVTIGCGYKGGEIIPTFFIGSTLGCLCGTMFGFDPAVSAAIGLVAMFCSVMNCPITSIFLSTELFGSQYILFFAVACTVSYLLSGYYGLYKGQKIMYSKLRAQFINRNTK